ncbi:MAG: hypothetical protein R3E89_14625 [Thiolinea sp.]
MEQEFLYHVPWHSTDSCGGQHAGTRVGSGIAFHSHTSLLNHPDVRHLDLYTSLRDPTGQYHVRRFRQASSLNVMVLADLSASLASFDKYRQLITISRCIAWSSYRNGDRFAFLAGADELLPDLHTPLTRHFASLQPLWEQLSRHQPRGQSIHALLNCAQHLPAQRSLVFLLTDGHMPLDTLKTLLGRLAMHDVVPLLLWHEKEYENLPNWRFLRLRDPESRQVRSLWMRPRLQQAIRERFAAQRSAIRHCCLKFGRAPLFINGTFQAEQLTDYFLGGQA